MNYQKLIIVGNATNNAEIGHSKQGDIPYKGIVHIHVILYAKRADF